MNTSDFRPNSLFVSSKTHKALRLVATAKELRCADDLAEWVLESWLAANHANVIEHVKNQQQAEADFAKSLKSMLRPKQPIDHPDESGEIIP